MLLFCHGPLARYVKLPVARAPGMPGTFSPPPPVSDSDMHHGTCVTHVPWYMPSKLAVSFEVVGGENVPGIPGACATPKITYLVKGPWSTSHDVPVFIMDISRLKWNYRVHFMCSVTLQAITVLSDDRICDVFFLWMILCFHDMWVKHTNAHKGICLKLTKLL